MIRDSVTVSKDLIVSVCESNMSSRPQSGFKRHGVYMDLCGWQASRDLRYLTPEAQYGLARNR